MDSDGTSVSADMTGVTLLSVKGGRGNDDVTVDVTGSSQSGVDVLSFGPDPRDGGGDDIFAP